MSYLANSNFFLDVQKGEIPNHFARSVIGQLPFETTDGEIWPSIWDLYYPLTAIQVEITANSLSDNRIGSGARTIQIEGLDSSYNVIYEVITLPGFWNAVTTTNYFLRILKITVLTAGYHGTNWGDILVRTTINQQLCIMYEESGESLQTHYTIPSNYTGYLYKYYFSILKASSISAEFKLWLTPYGQASTLKSIIGSDADGVNSGEKIFKAPLKIPEKTDIKMTVQSSSNNGDVIGGYDLILVKNYV